MIPSPLSPRPNGHLIYDYFRWFIILQIQGMRLQQEIMGKVQLAYKTGDRKEAERLLARLKPEEPKA